MHRFCSNNALYSANLSFMFIFFFFFTPFDTKDCNYFESNLSLVLLIKVFLTKKACNVVWKPSKHEEITFPKEFIFGFIPYFVGVILSKKCQKWRLPKKYIKGGWPCRGLSIERWIKLSARYATSIPEVYSEASQTSKIKLFVKIVNGFQPLTIFVKSSILNVWQASEYAFV